MNDDPLTTKVTKIKNRWHCRLYRDTVVHDEMACSDRRDISFCIREMCRWYDKMGYLPHSKLADASRHRGKNHKIHGKIFYRHQLNRDK